jgi:chromosome segregation ATPase
MHYKNNDTILLQASLEIEAEKKAHKEEIKKHLENVRQLRKDIDHLTKHLNNMLNEWEGHFDTIKDFSSDEGRQDYLNAAIYMTRFHNRPASKINEVQARQDELPY